MKTSGAGGAAGGGPENTKYAQEDDNTKYAQEDDNTKYAQEDDNTKYAQEDDNTKYAQEDDNTKYAQEDDNTKYAQEDDNTKYAQASGGAPASVAPLLRRRAVDAAIEEALMSAASAVDRVHPSISNETRARLVGTLIEKFGSELLEAHLGVTRSERRR